MIYRSDNRNIMIKIENRFFLFLILINELGVTNYVGGPTRRAETSIPKRVPESVQPGCVYKKGQRRGDLPRRVRRTTRTYNMHNMFINVFHLTAEV